MYNNLKIRSLLIKMRVPKCSNRSIYSPILFSLTQVDRNTLTREHEEPPVLCIEPDDSDHNISSHHFEYLTKPLETQDENTQYEFEYNFDQKSPSFESYNELRSFTNSIISSFIDMEIGTTKLTKMFHGVGKLIDKIASTNIYVLRHSEQNNNIENMITTTSEIVKSEICIA